MVTINKKSFMFIKQEYERIQQERDKYKEVIDKVKEYVIGDFRTDNLNDTGIATYYYKQWTFLQEQNFEYIKRLTEKDKKIQQLEDELQWYKDHLQIELVNLERSGK